MSLLKDDNYTVIQGWMLKDLGLKGSELIIYAIIYGFSQAEGQAFNGSLRYLAEWTNSTKRAVMNNLNSLIEKDLIEKKEEYINGVKFCTYWCKKFTGVVKKVHRGIEKSSPGGGEKSSPNNIDIDNKEDNKAINKEEIRHKYGEYKNVLLSDEQMAKLREEFPNDWQKRIEALSTYCASTGKRYKNHLATIRAWARRDAEAGRGRLDPKEEEYIKMSTEGDLPF